MHVRITKTASILLGTLFGFLLVWVGATTFDVQAAMFLFEDFQLPIVLAVAMVSAMVGVYVIRKKKINALIGNTEINFSTIPFSPRLILGSLFFGVGWAVTASCPGTAVAMLGEGKLIGVPVILGILAGTWLFGLYNTRSAQS